VRGVLWRFLLRWGVLNIPAWIEPAALAVGTTFFLLWGPGRRGVMRNLTAIKPRSSAIANFFRCYRVFWNYACTITDNARFREQRTIPDWEFIGWEHFTEMESRDGGAILLTAHMGSYDLGAQLFAETSERHIVMVRAPEVDPETRRFEEQRSAASMRIEFNTKAADLALELLETVRGGGIVAIQGDRMTEGISGLPATLFGKSLTVPAGPFALAMAARVPIYPVFVIRAGRRRYRLLTAEPIEIVRSRDRDADFARAAAAWTATLERVVSEHWQQWFTFEPYSPELAA
jgi:lauroyl/myristoyl acyltransferase